LEHVGFDDRDSPIGPEPATKHFCVADVQFNGDDASGRARERLGDPPDSGPELHHEIGRADVGLGDQFASQQPTAK
jgi:hypothetical protein